MKIKELIKPMNNHGTNPRIMVLKHYDGYSELIYEGSPRNVDTSIANEIVNSYTVKGKGFIEIHVTGEIQARLYHAQDGSARLSTDYV